ncbi:MAG: phosphatidate cytidylyltransferase [Candidatus Cloacimonadota bacterium]|nr:phosphatidate cytidylyltransferase [Candidatus Cloacimonadota bacterium]
MSKVKKSEIYRKAIHLGSLVIPFSYRYLLHYNKKLAVLYYLLPISVILFVFELLRLEHRTFKRFFWNFFGIMLRKHERSDFTGATYLMISSMICISLFPRDIAFLSLSFLAIGDTLAAIVGISFGKRKLHKSEKSLEGSLACFLGTFVFALFFLDPQKYLVPVIALAGAIGATLAESSRIAIDDNVKIPIFSGLVMSFVNLFV